MFDDTTGVIRNCQSKNRQYNGQMKKGKQQSPEYYIENYILNNSNPTINPGCTRVVWNTRRITLVSL